MAVASFLADSTFRSGSSGTTSTVTGVPFGTASADRVVCVFFLTNFLAPTSVTIGGVSASVVGTAANDVTFMASAVVPTGTSGNVVATFSSSDQVQTFGVSRLTGASSGTPSDTLNVKSASGTPSGGIDVGAGGAIAAGCVFGSAGGWTGVTALFTDSGSGFTVGAFDNSGGALTNRTVSYAASGGVIVAAAFDASGGGGGTVVIKGSTMQMMGV